MRLQVAGYRGQRRIGLGPGRKKGVRYLFLTPCVLKKKVSGTFFLQHRALRATEKGVRYLYLLTGLGGTYTTTVRTETADFADHADKLIKTKVSGTFFL